MLYDFMSYILRDYWGRRNDASMGENEACQFLSEQRFLFITLHTLHHIILVPFVIALALNECTHQICRIQQFRHSMQMRRHSNKTKIAEAEERTPQQAKQYKSKQIAYSLQLFRLL